MNVSLYEIGAAYRTTAREVEACEEVPEDLEARFASIEATLDEKVHAYCSLNVEFESAAVAARTQAKRLQKLAQFHQNAADRLWAALELELSASGFDEYRIEEFRLRFQNNPLSIDVDCDPLTLPIDCQRITSEPDKKALMARYKAGGSLPPGVTVKQTRSLRMK